MIITPVNSLPGSEFAEEILTDLIAASYDSNKRGLPSGSPRYVFKP